MRCHCTDSVGRRRPHDRSRPGQGSPGMAQAFRRLALVSALAFGVASEGLRAQSVRGTTVDQSGVGVPGVVVQLIDMSGAVVGRSLTAEAGDFRVQARGPGQYRLRTMRVGFRPVTSDAFALEIGQELMRPLSLTGLPFSLETVNIEGRNPCRTPADSGAVVFALWDQARTAMNAVQLTSGSRGVGATLLTYERALDPDRERIIRQGSSIHSGLTRGIWNAATMEQLRRTGYI